jgi:hypothetical protein
MLRRNLLMGFVLTVAASLTGCNCCKHGCNTCASPVLVGARPCAPGCSSCGGPGAPVGVVPPPPAAVVPGPAPAPGPYGASFERGT